MMVMNILKQVWQAIWQNKYLALLLVIVAVAAGGWYYFNREVEVPSAPAERVVKVALLSGDLSNLTIKASGRVKSEQEAALSAQIAGVVQGVYTQVGSQVPSGAILLELNNVDQAAAVTAARANVRTPELAVEGARHSSFNTGLQAFPVFSGNKKPNFSTLVFFGKMVKACSSDKFPRILQKTQKVKTLHSMLLDGSANKIPGFFES